MCATRSDSTLGASRFLAGSRRGIIACMQPDLKMSIQSGDLTAAGMEVCPGLERGLEERG